MYIIVVWLVGVHVVCQLNSINCIRNPVLASVSLISRCSDSASCPLPAVPVTTSAAHAIVVYECVSIWTRPGPWGSGAVEIAPRDGIIPGSLRLA